MTVKELLDLKQSYIDRYNKSNNNGNKIDSVEIYYQNNNALVELPTDNSAEVDVNKLFVVLNIFVSKECPMLSKVICGELAIKTLKGI